jgi:hypothetical protein
MDCIQIMKSDISFSKKLKLIHMKALIKETHKNHKISYV